MTINAPEPVTLAAIPEKALPALWFRQFIMNIPSPTMLAPMTAEFGPWSGDHADEPVWRDRSGNDLAKSMTFDIWDMRQTVPKFDVAYKAFIEAIPDVMVELKRRADEAEAARIAESQQP